MNKQTSDLECYYCGTYVTKGDDSWNCDYCGAYANKSTNYLWKKKNKIEQSITLTEALNMVAQMKLSKDNTYLITTILLATSWLKSTGIKVEASFETIISTYLKHLI